LALAGASRGCKRASNEGEKCEPESPIGEMVEIIEQAKLMLIEGKAYLVSHHDGPEYPYHHDDVHLTTDEEFFHNKGLLLELMLGVEPDPVVEPLPPAQLG